MDKPAPTALATHADDPTPCLLHALAAFKDAAPAEIAERVAPTAHPLPPNQQNPYATTAAPPATEEIVPAWLTIG